MSDENALITIPVTNSMMEAAELLWERLTEKQFNALWESMNHVTSMDLTDADFGIVDADPVDGSTRTPER